MGTAWPRAAMRDGVDLQSGYTRPHTFAGELAMVSPPSEINSPAKDIWYLTDPFCATMSRSELPMISVSREPTSGSCPR